MSKGRSPKRFRPFRLRVPPREARPPRTYAIDPQAHANLRRILQAKENAAMTNYNDLFTEDVVARWWRLYQRGKSLNWIARNNGLRKTTGNTIKHYFIKYGYISEEDDLRANAQQAAEETPEPAELAPEPQPEPDAIIHAVAGDAAGLDEQLSAIQQIMSTVRAQNVAISGKITLQLNVEISV